MIDKNVFSQLCDDVGEQLALQLLGVYVSESRKQIADLNNTDCANTIRHIAHSLKSSSRSYGALLLAQTCELIEMTSTHTDVTFKDLEPLIDKATSLSEDAFLEANKLITNK
ncbi:hypothetical protein PSECIP111951_02593 [Pseudoalteromonas holothuriae]|uniref:HPt domain-containing protein n=1 Tax=Pseudoalteromonas holothuriae TaxID=2963714 RepID=A0A9W4R0Z2_9GAMM|nr:MULTISPECIES: Hpt domain-containing protein [unclassified Pseudoalteromonas]CAH9061947.1 hypothetical protein PSECIP111951_02593 [Pseudoalteromonas sp. CIP111951]CAH9062237.1 hypothetical protein PSECIP111854_02972 [Pseudoalteromonas sp. CIP111854]